MSGGTRSLLSLSDPEGALAFGRALTAGGFTSDSISKTLRIEALDRIPVNELPAYLKLLPPGSPVSAFIPLFLFGFSVRADQLAAATKELGLDRLQALGVIRVEGEMAVPLIRILPFGGHLFVADRRYEIMTDTPADYVLAVNQTSEHLALITPRRRVGSALDVGCGCGVLSILAARFCDRVVATDINPRALNFTAFNAQLNGVTNVECLEGSLLEPVAGRTFDLILSNPPFVISPDSTLQFRDSGWPLDSFCAELVRKIPVHLNEGGLALVLCNWVVSKGEERTTRPGTWIAGGGCDAIVFHMQGHTPLEYAGMWNRPIADKDPKGYEAAIDRWMSHYRDAGVESIASGRIILRKRSVAENWAFSVNGAITRTPGSGDQILRMIDAQDWLERAEGPQAILATVFRPAEDLRLEQTLGFRDGRMAPVLQVASQALGFQFRSDLDPISWRLLSGLDGRRSLQQLVEAAAAESGMAVPDVAARAVPVFQGLLAVGFLLHA
jgi:SAM-dependent methyltransferase